MIWALKNNEKTKATPKEKAICPLCNEEVISKCGEIKVWHWSHKADFDCDSFGEPETEWHINWKNNFPKEQQEVIIGKHRADIKTKNGIVIELQNSSLSTIKIKEREEFYKNMIWLLNGKKLANNLDLRKNKDIITFRWKHPPKSWWYSKKPIYIDLQRTFIGKPSWYEYGKAGCFNEYYNAQEEYELFKNKIIFQIKKIYPNIPCGGWGILLSKEEFLEKLK
jgi:competence CoiA-like predicted nuclease